MESQIDISERVQSIMSKCSTCTIMVYTNVELYFKKIFTDLYVTHICPVPLTKKQRNVDKRKLCVPYGSIIGLRHGNSIRGLFLGKKKRKICQVCNTKITMSILFRRSKETNNFNDIKIINYLCPQCDTVYNGKLEYFLNQVTILISLGGSHIINVMLFKDSIKITGCKSENDAISIVMILWENYLLPLISEDSKSDFVKLIERGESISSKVRSVSPLTKNPYFKVEKERVEFVFETVMKNIDFFLGYNIDREALNMLMNSKKYSKYIFMSNFEPTGQTSVNIKMFVKRPTKQRFTCLYYPHGNRPKLKDIESITQYKRPKRAKPKYNTFIVFESSKTKLSGCYDRDMCRVLKIFLTIIGENKNSIEQNFKSIDKNSLRAILREIKDLENV